MRHLLKLLLLALLISLSPNLKADILRVPTEYPDIAAALGAVSGCDTIMISPGTYSGPGFSSLTVDTNCITIMSWPDSGGVTIELSGGKFLTASWSSYWCLVRGIKFRTGAPAIDCWHGYGWTITNCIFDSCATGILMGDYSTVTVDSCLFIGGTGVDSEFETLGSVVRCRFFGCEPAIWFGGSASFLEVFDNLFSSSPFAALWYYNGELNSVPVRHNVFYKNVVAMFAYEVPYERFDYHVTCNLFFENYANFGEEIPNLIGLYNNIEANPRFCDSTLATGFGVATSSPALAANSPCDTLLANLSIGCDCCFGATGNIDYDDSDLADISDLSTFVDYLFFSGSAPTCTIEADLNPDATLDISDLSMLVDFLFFGGQLPACP